MHDGTVADLKISVKDGKVCEKILKIDVGSEDIQKEFEEFYRAVAPKAKIPGFRPGKAPKNILELHYKQEARENVLKHLINESYRQALRDKSLEPLGYPEIENVKFEENVLSYEAKIEIRPKVKLSKYEGLSVKKEIVEVKPEEIEESMTRLRKSFAQHKVVEDRPAQLGDFVIADYVCHVEGKEIDRRKDDWFELREKEFLTGFSPQIAGMKAGEEKEIKIILPENFGRKDLAKKEATFKVKVTEIKNEVLPELNDELAKSAGDYKTLDELKEKISKEILEAKQEEKESEYEKALLDELIKQNKFDLPEGLVARRAEHLFQDTLENYQRRGVPADKLKELEEQLKKDIALEARRQIHLAFLLDEIAEKHNLSVTEEDLKKKFEWVASRTRQSEEEVEKYYAEHEEGRHSLKDQIRNEKAIEYVKSNAKQK